MTGPPRTEVPPPGVGIGRQGGDDESCYYGAADNPTRWLLRRFSVELRDYVSDAPAGDFGDEGLETFMGTAEFAEAAWANRDRFIRDARRDFAPYQKDLGATWKRGLDSLFYFILQCVSTGNTVLQRHHRLGRSPDPLVTALRHLHGRACRVAWEIHTLLSGGFGDGAEARWRTLHEITVSATFIRLNGSQCAQRFLDHDLVTTVSDVETRARVMGIPLPDDDAFKGLAASRGRLVTQHGASFKQRYGWAAADLSSRGDPTFEKIESAAGMSAWRYAYSSSSHPVHADSRNLLSDFHLAHGSQTSLAGPSGFGLVRPATMTVRSLLQATASLLALYPRPWSLQDDEVRSVVVLDRIARKVMDAIKADDAIGNDPLDRAPTPLGALEQVWRTLPPPSRAALRDPLTIATQPLSGSDHESGTLPNGLPWASRATDVSPVSAMSEAYEALWEGRLEEATQFFDDVLTADGEHAGAWSGRARALALLGRLDDSVAALREAIRLSPEVSAYLVDLCAVLAMGQRHAEAVAVADRILALDANSIPALTMRAESLRGLGRLDESLAEFEHAAALAPDPAMLDHGIAETFRGMGRDEDALGLLTRELQNAPLFPVHSLLARADVLRRLGNLDLALQDLNGADRLTPLNGRILAARAGLKAGIGDRDGAIADARAAENAAPDDPGTLSDLSITIADLVGLDDALIIIDRALALDPQRSPAHVNRGAFLARMGRAAEARVEFEQAVACDPSNAQAHANFALILLSAEEVETALGEARRVVELDPSMPSGFGILGAALLAAGLNADAEATLTRALDTDADDWRSVYNRAVARVREGDLAAALSDLKRAVALHPETRTSLRTDPDLAAIRADQDNGRALRALSGQPPKHQTTKAKRRRPRGR